MKVKIESEGERQPNGRPKCDHDWVNRTDGYEEQCGPAICTKCGRYGCWCTANYDRMTPEQQKRFKARGIPGNDHEIEKNRRLHSMGVAGHHVTTFAEANLACCSGIDLDARYPHVFFDVVAVHPQRVELKSHGDGTLFSFDIHKSRKGKKTEYAEITQQCPMGRALGMKPETFRIYPMKGGRF